MNLPGLNFMLGDDIDALRDAVRGFAESEIAPRAAEIDQHERQCRRLLEDAQAGTGKPPKRRKAA